MSAGFGLIIGDIVIDPQTLDYVAESFVYVGAVAACIVIAAIVRWNYWTGFYERLIALNCLFKFTLTFGRAVASITNRVIKNNTRAAWACYILSICINFSWVYASITNSTIIFAYFCLNKAGVQKKQINQRNVYIYLAGLFVVCSISIAVGYSQGDIVNLFSSYCFITASDPMMIEIVYYAINLASVTPMLLGFLLFLIAVLFYKFEPPDSTSEIYKWHRMFAFLTLTFFLTDGPFSIYFIVFHFEPAQYFTILANWTSVQNIFDMCILYKFIFKEIGTRRVGRTSSCQHKSTSGSYQITFNNSGDFTSLWTGRKINQRTR